MAAPEVTDAMAALARAALDEFTPAETVGPFESSRDEGEGVVSLIFGCTLPGYPGWRWTVSLAQVAGQEPTVLEAELMPDEGALVAPEWVPWADRLAEYRAQQAAARAVEAEDVDDDDGDDVDDDIDADADDDGDDDLDDLDLDELDLDIDPEVLDALDGTDLDDDSDDSGSARER